MNQNTDFIRHGWLPPDDLQCFFLYNEVHTRPSQRIHVPALVISIAVMKLLEKLTRGQELQLRLQRTVESLSIAAISYYVVSLFLYISKAGKETELPIHPELAVGILIPIIVFSV